MADQTHGIQRTDIADVHAVQVARSEIQVLIDLFRHDKHVTQLECPELAKQETRARLLDGKSITHHQALLANELRQDAAHCATVHLAVDLLAVVLGSRREHLAAAPPQRAANRACARTTRTLLTPRLAATAADFRSRLLSAGSLPTCSHVGYDHLMHERLVVLPGKSCLRDFDAAATHC
jgi:hypothetical protein